ncbi:MAG: T9SS type A sorting domain-containing protein [bacterium]|nr:T9SS type A sorting domain-containing protein [bacterium]
MLRLKYLVVLAICALGASQSWATNVTFQVNMNVQMDLGNFVPATDSVVVRGAFQGWSGYTHQLLDGDGDGIYVGTFDVAPQEAEYQYKFVWHRGVEDHWEDIVDPGHGNNRWVIVGDTPQTLPVVYFSNLESAASADVEVNFRVNMSVQTLSGNFDPATDWIVIRGNHTNIGNWGGAIRLLEETGNPGVYSRWVQFTDQSTVAPIEYKFVILTDGNPDDPTPGWESLPTNRMITPTGSEPDNLPPPSGNEYGEIFPEVVYWSNITPDDIITQDVAVTFRVEITPLIGRLADDGYVTDVQVNTDTVFTVEDIQVAGGSAPLTWSWANIAPEFWLNDNGTGGDETAGDDVWSVTITFPAGSGRTVEYKYGCNQFDVEASAGAQWNHFRMIDDSQPTYLFDIDCFGSTDTLYQDWACLISDADEVPTPVISSFSLEQNYPNPFNPTTTINFTLTRADVTLLEVFDVLGRNVATMNMGRMSAGQHTISFDGSSMASGVYFYKLVSGVENATRKMLLLK